MYSYLQVEPSFPHSLGQHLFLGLERVGGEFRTII
jgi:hypothetical protein